jgi:hypothetical protein
LWICATTPARWRRFLWHCGGDGPQQFIRFEGLFEKSRGANFIGQLLHMLFAARSNEDHWHLLQPKALDPFRHEKTHRSRHPYVQDKEIRPYPQGCAETLEPVVGHSDFIARRAQPDFQRGRDLLVIFDNQYLFHDAK